MNAEQTTEQLILEQLEASEDGRVTLSMLQRKLPRNSGVVRQQVDRMLRRGSLVEERTQEVHGETRWLKAG